MFEKRIVNPWQWQDGIGYSQAVETKESTRALYLAGQAAMDAEGRPSEADMAGQMAQAMENVATVLREAGYTMADIVRLNLYVTSVAECFPHFGEIVGRLEGNRPAMTLLEVNGLAFPSLKVELEVTAAK